MYEWKEEHGGGVVSHRLYVDRKRTQVYIMRKHGIEGPWVIRDGTRYVLERRALPHAKAAYLKLLKMMGR
ncbi:MAG: hypothetical protein PHW75_00865 [Patescibacteria group bacterium]|nr:hypothetical protein [Patescibacteria group bacterium]